MKIIIIASVLLFIVGTFSRIQNKNNEETQSEIKSTQEKVLSIQQEKQIPSLSPSSQPTKAEEKEEKYIETNENTNTNLEINEFIYPNSTIMNHSASNLELLSEDGADTITNWYKDKISSTNMTAKSYVVTKTNNNVLNKLVADDGELEIRIEIINNDESETTSIKVEFK